ncbi:hypothetical protein CPB84DRAFT_1750782 [Gymnopilus junonius]|uniref:F-box domain-containing protein n=1 Tax=Gymnopilus junonius TaxID=109634 RepID=A0A9P5NGW4_GYMJU|nr:hypothetical protein CPB84DRAFT_1750782 [Gymnopilus junonius]
MSGTRSAMINYNYYASITLAVAAGLGQEFESSILVMHVWTSACGVRKHQLGTGIRSAEMASVLVIVLCMNQIFGASAKWNVTCPMTNGERCMSCTKLKQLEVQIAAAQKTLDDLVEQHRGVRSQVNRAHDPISYRLPSEIASLIFQFYLPAVPPDGILAMKKQDRTAPLVLGAVCRYWRKIAWSTPQLWSLLSIHAGKLDSSMLLELSREWLDRSCLLPVSIGLYVSPSRVTDFGHLKWLDMAYSLCELVNQHSNRWQMLDISVPGSLFPRFRGTWDEHSLLQSLRLSNTDQALGEENFDVHDLKPSPTQLVLDYVSLNVVEIEWNALTHITVAGIAPADCLWVMVHCPYLRFCKFKIETKVPVGNGDVIVHDQLRQLMLDIEDPSAVYFFRSIGFPSLESLELHCSRLFPANHISVMFTNSSPRPLKKFAIRAMDMEQDKLISILQTLPSLQHLEINVIKDKAPSPDALLRLLGATSITNFPSQNVPDFLPALRYFAYHRPNSSTGYVWSLVPQIFGRLSDLEDPRRRPLKKVSLLYGCSESEPRTYISKKSLPLYLALLDKGLDLTICFGEGGLDFVSLSAHHQAMGNRA